ncbi:MAG: ATP-binding cassette domain-containing protein [Pseudomonadota bacterium]
MGPFDLPPVIRCVDVAKRFGTKVVLDGLALDVNKSETLVLLGRSGTGKSVLLRLLLGLIRPDRGQIWIGDREIGGASERSLAEIRRRIGMVFQGGALFDSLTVGENVAYGLRERMCLSTPAIEQRVSECLGLVDLPGIDSLMPSELSGGMKKRVAIARAIAPSPEILLFDEPTSGLDPATARRVNELVRDLRLRLGMTSVVVTHDIGTVRIVGDRIAVLERGIVGWAGHCSALDDSRPPSALVRFLGEEEGAPWIPPAGSH